VCVCVCVCVSPSIFFSLPFDLILCLPRANAHLISFFPASLNFYPLTTRTTDADVCQSVLPPLMNFVSFIPFVVVSALDGTGSSDVARTLHYVLAVLDPGYTLLGALYFVFRVQLVAAATGSASPVMGDYFELENNVMPTILIMLAHVVWMAAAVVLLESPPSLCERKPAPLLAEGGACVRVCVCVCLCG
jgi:hypothetical protein